MLFILPGSLQMGSSPCLELSIIKINIIVFEAHHILVLLHISSLFVRHRGRCPPRRRMTNINISYKYSNASHASFTIRFLFHMLQRKLRECKNCSQIHNLNLSPCSLSMKLSCESSKSQISLFSLSHISLPPTTSLAVMF